MGVKKPAVKAPQDISALDGDLALRANESIGRHDDSLLVHSNLAVPRVLDDPATA